MVLLLIKRKSLIKIFFVCAENTLNKGNLLYFHTFNFIVVFPKSCKSFVFQFITTQHQQQQREKWGCIYELCKHMKAFCQYIDRWVLTRKLFFFLSLSCKDIK